MDQLKQKRRKRARLGIKLKLLSSISACVLIMISLLIYFTYKRTSEIILEDTEMIIQKGTQTTISKVEAWIDDVITSLDAKVDTLQYFDLTPEEELLYIKHTVGQHEAYPDGIYLGITGTGLIHSSFVAGPEYKMYEKAWYINGLKTESFELGDVYMDENSKNYVVAAYGAIKDKSGNLRGTASADVLLKSVSSIVSNELSEKDTTVFLVDTNTDFIIGHPDPEKVGTLLLEQTDGIYRYASDILKQKNYGLQIETFSGENYYIEVQPIKGANWAVISYLPQSAVTATLSELNQTLMKIGGISTIALIILIERFIHIIVRPVKKLTKLISSMTEGDFTQDVKIKTRDEIGVMAGSLQIFIERMRRMISETTDIAHRLNEQASRSTGTADNLAHSSLDQSAQSTELCLTLDELAHSVSEVAVSAGTLANVTSDAQQQGQLVGTRMSHSVTASEKGRNDMKQVADSMSMIGEKINHLETSIKMVSQSTDEIERIVVLIRDIAEETNLLSLNASIEAARAGAAGLGFAVVADQIGKLADTSTEAVNNIENLTQSISGLISTTKQQMNESAEMIYNSTSVVNEISSAFGGVYEDMTKTNGLIVKMAEEIQTIDKESTDVAAITSEQSSAVEEIYATVELMKQSAELVSESSTQVAADAKNLKTMSETLVSHMDSFKA